MGIGSGVGEGTSVGVAAGVGVGVAVGSGDGVGKGVEVGGRGAAVSTTAGTSWVVVSPLTWVGWVKKLTTVAVGGGGVGDGNPQAVRPAIRSKFGKVINRNVLISLSIVINMVLVNSKTLPIISPLPEASKRLICVIMAGKILFGVLYYASHFTLHLSHLKVQPRSYSGGFRSSGPTLRCHRPIF